MRWNALPEPLCFCSFCIGGMKGEISLFALSPRIELKVKSPPSVWVQLKNNATGAREWIIMRKALSEMIFSSPLRCSFIAQGSVCVWGNKQRKVISRMQRPLEDSFVKWANAATAFRFICFNFLSALCEEQWNDLMNKTHSHTQRSVGAHAWGCVSALWELQNLQLNFFVIWYLWERIWCKSK